MSGTAITIHCKVEILHYGLELRMIRPMNKQYRHMAPNFALPMLLLQPIFLSQGGLDGSFNYLLENKILQNGSQNMNASVRVGKHQVIFFASHVNSNQTTSTTEKLLNYQVNSMIHITPLDSQLHNGYLAMTTEMDALHQPQSMNFLSA